MNAQKEILVLYYSHHGAVRQMAQLIARGIEQGQSGALPHRIHPRCHGWIGEQFQLQPVHTFLHLGIMDKGKMITTGTQAELVKLVGEKTRIDLSLDRNAHVLAEQWRALAAAVLGR